MEFPRVVLEGGEDGFAHVAFGDHATGDAAGFVGFEGGAEGSEVAVGGEGMAVGRLADVLQFLEVDDALGAEFVWIDGGVGGWGLVFWGVVRFAHGVGIRIGFAVASVGLRFGVRGLGVG